MKTRITKKLQAAMLLAGLSLLSYAGYSQEHLTLSLENITTTNNTIEYDLFIVNDGSTAIKLAACAYGVDYNNLILNGGVLSENAYTAIPGTKSQALAGLNPFSLKSTNSNEHSQLRMTTTPALFSQSPELLANVPYKVGRFKFTNSTAWASNSNPAFALNEYNVPGISTTCAVAYVNNSNSFKSFGTALKNLSCKVVNSPILNPSKGNGHDVILNNGTLSIAGNGKADITNNSKQISANANVDTKISLYPNPTQDVLNIDFSTAQNVNTLVKVLDMRGRVVKTIQRNSDKGFNSMSISLREVADGMYTVQVYQDNQLAFTDKVNKKN